MPTTSDDQLHRFIFEQFDLRGEILTLSDAFRNATAHQNLPPPAQRLLGEFLAAVSLLSESLKFSGTLTLQARGAGAAPLIMAEANADRSVRGILKLNEGIAAEHLEDLDWRAMIGKGVLSITLDPEKGQRYQGVVAVEGGTLADALSNYFAQSEQLPTRFWLYSDGQSAGGLMLQALPEQEADEANNREAWKTVETLAETLTAEELYQLPHERTLTRLFHEFEVRLFAPRQVRFACRCSKTRSAQALTSLGFDDAMALVAERDVIEMGCEFCGAQYCFGQEDLRQIFGPESPSVH